jgi:hypothetical protein
MGQFSQSGKFAHDVACNTAKVTRQATVAAAAQSPAGQVAVMPRLPGHARALRAARRTTAAKGRRRISACCGRLA